MKNELDLYKGKPHNSHSNPPVKLKSGISPSVSGNLGQNSLHKQQLIQNIQNTWNNQQRPLNVMPINNQQHI